MPLVLSTIVASFPTYSHVSLLDWYSTNEGLSNRVAHRRW